MAKSDQDKNALALSSRLNLPLIMPPDTGASPGDLLLAYNNNMLGISIHGHLAPGPVCVDFTNATLKYRVANAVKSQAIAKAVGIKPGISLRVIDATAGLGKDSFLLASLGCHVNLVEQSQIVFALLEDGFNRAQLGGDPNIQLALARMSLTSADFFTLSSSQLAADVIYLDPMFPKRTKSARVKKDMYVLQQLLGSNTSGDAMLDFALVHARRRVVVKRSRSATYLSGLEPSFELKGKSSRYDVYIIA